MSSPGPEELVQRAIVEYHRLVRPAALLMAIPNQRGTRTRAEMGVLWAMGVLAGAPDLILVMELARCALLEVKAPGKEGNLSPKQREVMVDATRLHIPYFVLSSVDDYQAVLDRYGLLRKRA